MRRYEMAVICCLLCTVLCSAKPDGKIYSDQYLTSLRIPVGGVGTGDILMGGRGDIEHVEVFNQPDRSRRLEKTFFALWFKRGERESVTKILERELFPPYRESTHKYVYGLPRIRNVDFENNFPLHSWFFNDEEIPIDISMEAFSPFVPLDIDQSSYPIVAFYWDITNTTQESVKGSLVFTMENPIRAKAISNVYYKKQDVQGIRFITDETDDINYQGGLIMGTTARDVDIQTHWYPGQWRDEAHIFWDDFCDDGNIESELSTWQTTYRPTSYNQTTRRMASLLVHFDLAAGEHIRIPYYLAWYFPTRTFKPSEVFGIQEAAARQFGNYYGRLFDSEADVLTQFLNREQELYRPTARFSQLIATSSYPESVRESLTTQAASLRTPLILVTAEGQAHGFEGVLSNGWCCPGTCTHVWNYEQTLASLFPSLERSMREIEFMHDTFDNGFQTHRSVFPPGDYWFDGPAAADGQMGTIVRAFREWKLSGDNQWLATLWPKMKKALEFAWTGPGKVSEARFKHQESQSPWDPNKRGILAGRQHNTYDINFYGPSSMTTSIYLAALKAGSEMAKAMNEFEKSKEYSSVFESGVQILQDSLWNGSYFIQIISNDSDRDLKYQYGDGCLADQLLGQYLAFISGLGYILDSSKVNNAIKAVYDFNFIRPLRSFANVQRVFALNDESGVVLCTWPNGNRPALPFVYSDEIWTGVEYQVASSLIYCGFSKEGLEIVDAVQERHDGYKRNPFEHDESGVHYARAMASWSLLLALSGFEYDGTTCSLSFDPKVNRNDFSTFWSTGDAWGGLKIESDRAVLSVDLGELELKHFSIKGRTTKSWEKEYRIAAGEQAVFKLIPVEK